MAPGNNTIEGIIVSVCTSDKKGVSKTDRGEGTLIAGHGLLGDAHAGGWHRQVSLLSVSSVEKMKARGLNLEHGAFAENLTVDGINLWDLPVGMRLIICGERDEPGPIVEVTQIGKECHSRCAIFHQVGDCVMPREGIFVRVARGGLVKAGDSIKQFSGETLLVATVTASDKGSRGEREDVSGQVLEELVSSAGGLVVSKSVLPDEQDLLSSHLVHLSDEVGVDLILTTGGTGLGPRDVTPEATLAVITRAVPGIAEAMRLESLKKTPRAMLSRAVAGVRSKTLIINLPGSPKAVRECFDVISPALRHAVQVLRAEVSECARP